MLLSTGAASFQAAHTLPGEVTEVAWPHRRLQSRTAISLTPDTALSFTPHCTVVVHRIKVVAEDATAMDTQSVLSV